jgi:DNA-binding response OmpR family regulator
MDMEDALSDAGWNVVATAPTVAIALTAIEHDLPQAAILDFNLNGETSVPVAQVLREKAILFIVVSGQPCIDQPDLRGVPFIGKPWDREELFRALAIVTRAE